MNIYFSAVVLAALTLTAVSGKQASAQQPSPSKETKPMSSMPMNHTMPMAQGDADTSASSKAFKAADDKMMKDMMAPKTGNADQDFVASMMPHHQGAIDMAKVELQYGKDRELRKLAQGIISAQQRELAAMAAWQKKYPVSR